jgi:hypothetical protein
LNSVEGVINAVLVLARLWNGRRAFGLRGTRGHSGLRPQQRVGRIAAGAPRGVTPTSGEDSYGDRRLVGTQFVDYSQPGFAVVYFDIGGGKRIAQSPPPPAQFFIRDGRVSARLEPNHLAQRAGGSLTVENQSTEVQIISCPARNLVKKLAPGEKTEIRRLRKGEMEVFLLGVPEHGGRIFVAPGPFAVVSSSGRFALQDLPPGRRRIAVWHPRFPPVSRWVELAAGEVTRIDLEVGVGVSEEVNNATD